MNYRHLIIFQLLLFYSLLVCVSSKTMKEYCKWPVEECVVMKDSMCLGKQLPYTSSSTDLVIDASTSEEALKMLEYWKILKKIPYCWEKIQPILCAYYMPNCENNTIYLPTQDMCQIMDESCQILKIENIWTPNFDCNNETFYPVKECTNDLTKFKFNSSQYHCEYPLVKSDRSIEYHYPGIEGCELQCYDPKFSRSEHEGIHNLIVFIGTITFICNMFVVLTFVIKWESLNRYPNISVLCINICFLFICIGWLSPFIFGTRDSTICRSNGGRRISEPSGGFLCILSFILSYYFLIAAFIWFDIFAYSLYKVFKSFGIIEEKVDNKYHQLNLAAWLIPLFLSIILMILREIDGDSVTGICFVGNSRKIYKIIFVVLPVFITFVIGIFFMLRVLFELWIIRKECTDIISNRTWSKLNSLSVKVFVIMNFVILFVSVMCMCYIYEYNKDELWKNSLRKYILCELGITPSTNGLNNCYMKFRPAVSIKEISIIVFFGFGILMSLWVCTFPIFSAWGEYLYHWSMKIRGHEHNIQQSTRTHRHKLISTAYFRRKQLNQDDYSISFSNEDPMGLCFGVNSDLTDDMSTSWAAVLHKLLHRRGAITTRDFGNNYHQLTLSTNLVSLSNYSRSSETIEATSKFGNIAEIWKSSSISTENIHRDIYNVSLKFPKFRNSFSAPDLTIHGSIVSIVSVPNLEKKTASDGNFGILQGQIKKTEIVSTSFSNTRSFSNNSNSCNSPSDSDHSEDFTLNNSIRYDRNVMYRSVSTGSIHLDKESNV